MCLGSLPVFANCFELNSVARTAHERVHDKPDPSNWGGVVLKPDFSGTAKGSEGGKRKTILGLILGEFLGFPWEILG